MKVICIFDQVQAGMGGKENPMLPLGGKNLPIGSASMLEPYLKKVDGHVVACLYCGDGFFKENENEVLMKLTAMCKKISPDVVICGPAFNYEGYGEMCAKVAKMIEEKTGIPSVAAMSQECDKTIEDFNKVVDIVKMPKKGGTGLSKALESLCVLAKMKVNKEDTESFVKKYCY